jgi:tetratricopeptide (TPR) repeat protein
MLKKASYTLILTLVAGITLSAQTSQRAVDTVMVLPFENKSDKPEFNWVGESFALALTDLLKVPGLSVIPNSERKQIQQNLRIPLTNIPSLATSLKLARAGNASILVAGRYTIVPSQADSAATVNISARIISVNEGRFLSEVIDGRQVSREIVLNDALGNLQTVQGQIAYQILLQRFGSQLTYSQNEIVVTATKVPARAFEAYIKGLLTPAADIRENFLKNAMRLHNETTPDGTFVDAALELGHLYLNQRKFNESVDAFEQVVNTNQRCREIAKGENRIVQCNDESFAEASFYIGLIRWQQGNYEQALGVLRPLADDLKLTSVYNTLGAIGVRASIAEKKNQARSAALLAEGLELLKKAAESSPNESAVQFNYGLALFLNGNFPEAALQLKPLIAANPRDGESYYVLAKALSSLNDPTATDVDNQARTYLASGNRYANLEKEWLKSKTLADIQPRVEQPHRKDFVSVILSQRASEPVKPAINETDNLLAQARSLYAKGSDDEATAVLRRILVSEPMSAESYLILGKIHLRHGDRDQATSALKTALFWDSRLIDAHIALGKIYLERGECLQVKTYAASALEIDPENQEAASLQRQSERCSK